MLSNQASRTPSHKRQKSSATIVGMELEAPFIQDSYTHQLSNHRRSLSLDQSVHLQDSSTTTLGNGTVSTNTGFNQQHTLRETQTQDQARPGYGHSPHSNSLDARTLTFFQDSEHTQSSNGAGSQETHSTTIKNGQPHTGYLACYGVAPPKLAIHGLQHGAPNMQGIQCTPQTPTKHSVADTYPLTPVTATRHGHGASFSMSSMVSDDVFEPPRTPDATPMKRSSSHQEVLMKRPSSSGSDIPIAPHTAPMPCVATFGFDQVSTAALLDISTLNMDFSSCGNGYNSSDYSPTTCRTSPAEPSLQSSPELGPVSLFGSFSGHIPHLPASHPEGMCHSPKSSRGHSPKKKSLQMPDDMIIAETGISNEEVEAFIQGPDPVTKEYTCMYENCKFKPFARKENIRSHIQTHLGDRKFVCGTCQSRFVRPNDLKRHAVIHNSFRDFVCICGAAFGRKDALRRHKLRNEKCARDEPNLQVLKKEEKKRGRPRKVAPTETAERRERKERIRKQVMTKKREGSVPSSVSTSYPSPGAEVSSPEAQDMQPMFQDYSPTMEMAYTPPASPEDVVINPCLTLQQPTHFSGNDNLSPPPTRGSMTAGLESIASYTASRQTTEVIDLDSNDFEPHPFGLPVHGGISHSSSTNCGSPPELDNLSSSPEITFFKPDNAAYDDLEPSLGGKVSAYNDFDFGASRSSTDDMFPLFGDHTMANSLEKPDGDLASLDLNHRDDAFWTKF